MACANLEVLCSVPLVRQNGLAADTMQHLRIQSQAFNPSAIIRIGPKPWDGWFSEDCITTIELPRLEERLVPRGPSAEKRAARPMRCHDHPCWWRHRPAASSLRSLFSFWETKGHKPKGVSSGVCLHWTTPCSFGKCGEGWETSYFYERGHYARSQLCRILAAICNPLLTVADTPGPKQSP